MSIMEYWPSRKNIVQCIRNEAEELEDHVLLAVHEPMLLTRRDVNELPIQHVPSGKQQE